MKQYSSQPGTTKQANNFSDGKEDVANEDDDEYVFNGSEIEDVLQDPSKATEYGQVYPDDGGAENSTAPPKAVQQAFQSLED